MYFVLSPAKNLNEKNDLPFDFSQHYTQPALMAHACELMGELKTLAPTDLSALMSISAKLGQLNAVRNQNWRWDTTQPFSTDHADIPAKAALYLFDGDVYTGLAAKQMTEQQVHYVNERLGILSGLYGLLKPLDLMLPYRLEMGTKLKNPRGDNLYQFWGDTLANLINQRMAENKHKVLVNLASNEYFKAVNPKKISADIITPRFEDGKNGQYKVVSFYAKKARGLMVRFAAENQLTTAQQLKDFNLEGYQFVENASSTTEYVFRRDNK